MNGADGLALYQLGCIEYVIVLICLGFLTFVIGKALDLFD